MECQEKNCSFRKFRNRSRHRDHTFGSPRVEVMREREHRSGENVVPCMRNHSGTKTAAKNRETAEERAIRGDRDHARCSFIRVTAAEEQR